MHAAFMQNSTTTISSVGPEATTASRSLPNWSISTWVLRSRTGVIV